MRVGELMRGIVGAGVVPELAEVEGGGGDRYCGGRRRWEVERGGGC